MHIAICIWGIVRSLKFTIDSLHTYCLDPIVKAGHTYEIYMHTYSFSGVYDNPRNNERNLRLNFSEWRMVQPDHIYVEDQDLFDASANYDAYHTLGDPWKNDFRSFKNHLRAMNSLHYLATQIEKDSHHKHFDGIVYLRPDVTYLNELPFHLLEHLPNTLFVPDFHRSCRGGQYNDRMAMGDLKTGLIYGKKYEAALAYAQTKPLHSESFVYDYLHMHNVTVREIPFRFRRTRAKGEYHVRDSTAIVAPRHQKPVPEYTTFCVLRWVYTALEIATGNTVYVWNHDDSENLYCKPHAHLTMEEVLAYRKLSKRRRYEAEKLHFQRLTPQQQVQQQAQHQQRLQLSYEDSLDEHESASASVSEGALTRSDSVMSESALQRSAERLFAYYNKHLSGGPLTTSNSGGSSIASNSGSRGISGAVIHAHPDLKDLPPEPQQQQEQEQVNLKEEGGPTAGVVAAQTSPQSRPLRSDRSSDSSRDTATHPARVGTRERERNSRRPGKNKSNNHNHNLNLKNTNTPKNNNYNNENLSPPGAEALTQDLFATSSADPHAPAPFESKAPAPVKAWSKTQTSKKRRGKKALASPLDAFSEAFSSPSAGVNSPASPTTSSSSSSAGGSGGSGGGSSGGVPGTTTLSAPALNPLLPGQTGLGKGLPRPGLSGPSKPHKANNPLGATATGAAAAAGAVKTDFHLRGMASRELEEHQARLKKSRSIK